MKTFEISVKDKIATLTNRSVYVCGNSDFVVDFSFDAEWDAYDTKTARFAYNGTYQDQVFQGNQCPVPIIHDTQIIMVGVFAGNLHTTTAACISARRSILSGSGVPADPAPDVYAQIMELIQGLGEPDPETIATAVADYIRNNPIAETDPTVPAWAKQPTKPAYTAAEVGALPDTYTPPNQTAQQVGADPAGTATTAVSQHNVDTAAHNDLRLSLQELATRVNAALDSDDTTLDQMSEVVTYIKYNKTLIDAITTSKVSVADIVNDLVTNAAGKPLSAAQGVVIKTLIDALRNDKLDAAELTNAVNTALAQAKESGEFDGKPGDPGYTPVKGTDYFTEADKQEIAEQAAGLVSIPDKLPNPNALTFTGAVTGSYDGSAPLSVEIPQGGSWNELKDKPFYLEKTLVIELTKNDFTVNDQAGYIDYIYRSTPKLDWFTSAESIAFEIGIVDTNGRRYTATQDSIDVRIERDTTDDDREYWSCYSGLFEIVSGVDLDYYDDEYRYKDEWGVLVKYGGIEFSEISIKIYRVDVKKIPKICLDAAIGKTAITVGQVLEDSEAEMSPSVIVPNLVIQVNPTVLDEEIYCDMISRRLRISGNLLPYLGIVRYSFPHPTPATAGASISFDMSSEGDTLWDRVGWYSPWNKGKYLLFDLKSNYSGGGLIRFLSNGNSTSNLNGAVAASNLGRLYTVVFEYTNNRKTLNVTLKCVAE